METRVREVITKELTDAICVRVGYKSAVDFKHEYDGLTPEQLVARNRRALNDCQFNYWPELEQEVADTIHNLKDDELELGRFIRDKILLPLSDPLWLYYGAHQVPGPTDFQTIVAALLFINPLDIPDALIELHRKHVNTEVTIDKTIDEGQREQEIARRCRYTDSFIKGCSHDELFQIFRYFHICFRRLACIVETNLLLNHCRKDLFAYQKELDIVLYPLLRIEEIAMEMNMTVDYVKGLADGYSQLDYYTEFAGYGVLKGSLSPYGVDYTGIPEIDSLLVLTRYDTKETYPEQHFYRNRLKFKGRCQSMLKTIMPQEMRELLVVPIVHLLCYCYDHFIDEPSREAPLTVVRVFLSDLEAIALKSANPVCIKKICVDLDYDEVLAEPHPDEGESKKKNNGKRAFIASWEELGLSSQLSQSLFYYEKRMCKKCDRKNCQFRKEGENPQKDRFWSVNRKYRHILKQVKTSPSSISSSTVSGDESLTESLCLPARKLGGHALSVKYKSAEAFINALMEDGLLNDDYSWNRTKTNYYAAMASKVIIHNCIGITHDMMGELFGINNLNTYVTKAVSKESVTTHIYNLFKSKHIPFTRV